MTCCSVQHWDRKFVKIYVFIFCWKYGHSIKNKNTLLKIKKPIDLWLSILELSKTVMNKFCYIYVNPKYGEKTKCAIWIQIVSLYI